MKNNKVKLNKKILIIIVVIVATIFMIVVNETKERGHFTKEPTLKPIEIKKEPEKVKPTTEEELTEESDKKQEQSALDMEYTQQVKEFYEAYPMFEFLPIETEDYRVVYSVEKDKYRIRIKKNSNEITEQEKQILVNKALKDIKQAGEEGEIKYYVLTKDQ